MLQVARVPETLRVREHIDLFSSYYPHPLSIAETMEAAGVRELANRKFGELSGGEKQRTLFALALCGNPDLLFLDEPTVGMDVEARRGMWKQIRGLAARGKSVLLTTHYLEEAEELCDRIAIINHGRVIANEPTRELVSKAQEKAVVVTFDRDIAQVPTNACFQDIKLVDERTLEITYRKDQANAGQVLSALTSDGLAIVDVSTRDPDLEDVFLSLTSAEREAA